jgi:uncharacterized BrkB/YihY/UPF0761 family membrane protein
MRAHSKGGLVALVLFLAFVIFKILQTGGYSYFLSSVPSWAGGGLGGIVLFIVALVVMSAVFYIIGALIGEIIWWIFGKREEALEEKK